jgi:hypothetical protein
VMVARLLMLFLCFGFLSMAPGCYVRHAPSASTVPSIVPGLPAMSHPTPREYEHTMDEEEQEYRSQRRGQERAQEQRQWEQERQHREDPRWER